MSTFPSLNIEKLRNDTIKKLEKEKQDKINREKQQQKHCDISSPLNTSPEKYIFGTSSPKTSIVSKSLKMLTMYEGFIRINKLSIVKHNKLLIFWDSYIFLQINPGTIFLFI